MALVQPTTFKGSASDTYTAARLRRLAQSLIVDQEGVLGHDHMLVVADSPASLRARVGAGRAWVAGDAVVRQGAYLIENDATATTPFAGAAHATLPRRDLLVLRVHDAAADGGSDSTDIDAFEVVAGTANASPVAPALPAGAIPLAELLINAAATVIASITDRRPFAAFMAPGANLLGNAMFDEWSRGTTSAPDGWNIFGASSVRVAGDGNLYGSQVTNTAASAGQVYQYVDASAGAAMTVLAGRPLTFTARVLATVAGRVRLNVSDQSNNAYSAYHSGSGLWETLTATLTPRTDALGKWFAQLLIDAGSAISASITRASLVLGLASPPVTGWRQPALDALYSGRVHEHGRIDHTTYASTGGQTFAATLQFQTRKAAPPTITFSTTGYTNASGVTSPTATADGFAFAYLSTAVGLATLGTAWDAVV